MINSELSDPPHPKTMSHQLSLDLLNLHTEYNSKYHVLRVTPARSHCFFQIGLAYINRKNHHIRNSLVQPCIEGIMEQTKCMQVFLCGSSMAMEPMNSMWNMTVMVVKFPSTKKHHSGSWIGAIKRVYDEVYQAPPGVLLVDLTW